MHHLTAETKTFLGKNRKKLPFKAIAFVINSSHRVESIRNSAKLLAWYWVDVISNSRFCTRFSSLSRSASVSMSFNKESLDSYCDMCLRQSAIGAN